MAWLIVVVGAGVLVGIVGGPWWGVAAALVTLGVSEAVERTRRNRIRRRRGDTRAAGVRDVVRSRRDR